MKSDLVPRRPTPRKVLLLLLAVLSAAVIAWCAVRRTATVTCAPWQGPAEAPYTESEKVVSAIALSCLAYGCESAENLSGTAGTILDTQKMGIILENADITRRDKADPATAMIDSAAFIRQAVGRYRFLTDLRDRGCGFYGVAFADDENRTVWIAYSGSVSLVDAVESLGLALGAGLTRQEKCAFSLYGSVLQTEEIREGYALLLTGHSLGGAHAAMISRMSGAEAVTVSGADGLALRKLNGILGEGLPAYRIANYMTAPTGFSFMDCVHRTMFWGDLSGFASHIYPHNGMTDNVHCVFGFIQFEDGDLARPVLPEEIR